MKSKKFNLLIFRKFRMYFYQVFTFSDLYFYSLFILDYFLDYFLFFYICFLFGIFQFICFSFSDSHRSILCYTIRYLLSSSSSSLIFYLSSHHITSRHTTTPPDCRTETTHYTAFQQPSPLIPISSPLISFLLPTPLSSPLPPSLPPILSPPLVSYLLTLLLCCILLCVVCDTVCRSEEWIVQMKRSHQRLHSLFNPSYPLSLLPPTLPYISSPTSHSAIKPQLPSLPKRTQNSLPPLPSPLLPSLLRPIESLHYFYLHCVILYNIAS